MLEKQIHYSFTTTMTGKVQGCATMTVHSINLSTGF